MLYTDPSFPVRFQYAGKGEGPDSNADILDAQGPDGFAGRLFLDENTHRLLSMSYADPSSGKTEKLGMEEYRETSGILFPHLLTRTEDGKLKEVLRLEKFEVDAHVDARDFRK